MVAGAQNGVYTFTHSTQFYDLSLFTVKQQEPLQEIGRTLALLAVKIPPSYDLNHVYSGGCVSTPLLIATLGRKPQLITLVLDELRAQHIEPNTVVVVHTRRDRPVTGEALARLQTEFARTYPPSPFAPSNSKMNTALWPMLLHPPRSLPRLRHSTLKCVRPS